MKPKFGLGRMPGITPAEARGEQTEPVGPLEPPGEGVSSLGGPLRSPNEPPIRPDLGPPAPGPQSANQPGSGLGLVISVAISIAVFVLAIYATGSPTPNPLPLAQTTNALYWAVALIAVVAAGVGAEYADRTASRAHEHDASGDRLATAWVVPTIATAAAVTLVATFHNSTMIVAGPLVAFLGNAGALLSRDLLDDADDSAQRSAATVHTLVVHAVAFLALSAIYLNKLPPIATALAAGTVGTAPLSGDAGAAPRSAIPQDRPLRARWSEAWQSLPSASPGG